jgi:hypothetical protein
LSNYAHDLKKFADSGLQLRLPVDMIPATQYGRLTNCLPVIEGELRTRDGMTLIGNVTKVAFLWQFPGAAFFASIANTQNANGFIPGDAITIIILAVDPANAGQIALGTYNVSIIATISPTQFSFTPGIAVGPVLPTSINVQAMAISTNPVNVLPDTVITNIFRLNEAVTGVDSERIVCMNGRVFNAPLPAGNSFSELVGPIGPNTNTPTAPTGFNGQPMAIISFQFNLDTATWAIFADGAQMYKYRPGVTAGQFEFVPLGNDFPTVAAIASAGGTGNLNSTGGTGYDWRYTYVDGLALTESNPSPITLTPGSLTTTRPTAFHNGVDPFSGVTVSSGTGGENFQGGNGFPFTRTANCSWGSWLQAAGTIDSTVLQVRASFQGSIVSDPKSGGSLTATITYTYGSGGGGTLATFTTGAGGGQNRSLNSALQTYSAVIPSSISLTNIGVSASVQISGSGAPGSFVTCNAQLVITDINTLVQVEASTNSLTLVNKIAQVCVQPPRDKWQTFINLYRRGGSLPDTWRFVSQSQVSALSAGVCVSGALEIDDNVSDTTLSTSDIIQLDNDQPVTSVTKLNQPLSFIWGPVGIDARVLGVGDPARPESVYFSKPGNADAWPPQNWLPVSDPGTPLIAGCVFNTRTFTFSRESIYELVEGLGTGATYTPFRTPSAHGLFTAQGLAVGPAMYFIAKDGIYETTGAQEQSLVENDIKPLFPTYDTPGQSVEGYEAIDYTQPLAMRLRYHNDELYFAYIGRDTGTRQVLIYDILKKRWRAMQASTGISELYSEPNTVSSLLYGMSTGTVYQAGGTGDPTELDVLESIGFTTIAAVTVFPAVTYYFRVVRYTSAGPVALSYETGLAVSPTLGVQVTFPAITGTLKWRVFIGNTGAQTNYTEFLESALPAGRTVVIVNFGTAGTIPANNVDSAISVAIRTGAHDQGAPLNRKQYGNVIVDLDPGGATLAAPVTITPLVNGETITEAALTVTGTGRQQVPLDLSDYFGFNTEYQVNWTRTPLGGGVVTDPVLFQYDTLHFLEPVGVTHWEAQPTSFEFPGFMHVRDCYIAIRSTATVTLTVTMDTGTGTPVVQTYTLLSTNGNRMKQYVQLASNKALLYQLALDSTTEFRVYESDLEIRVKPWLGLLGYSVQRTLGGESEA